MAAGCGGGACGACPHKRPIVLALACLALALYFLLYCVSAPASGLVVTSDALLVRLPPDAQTSVASPQLEGVLTEAVYVPGHDVVGDLEVVCPDGGKGLKLLIAVASAPAHREARQAVRQTWGNVSQHGDVSLAFMLGATTATAEHRDHGLSDDGHLTEHRDYGLNGHLTQHRDHARDGHLTELESSLAVEAAAHGDLVRGRFLDTYDNLTLKTVSMLEWVERHCPGVGFVLKADDDMFINVDRLVAFIGQQQQQHRVATATTTVATATDPDRRNSTRAIFGRVVEGWRPVRDPSSKYYVSSGHYAPHVFPAFTTGPAYLVTRNAVSALYAEALRRVYLKLEDVFVTGIVADAVDVSRVLVKEFVNDRVNFLDPCPVRAAISIHMVKPREQFDIWRKLQHGSQGRPCDYATWFPWLG